MYSTFKSFLKTCILKLCGQLPDRGPDFFVVGATRAGTTYLHHLLASHPDVFMPWIKELHYFDHDGRYASDLSGYLPMFDGYHGEALIGEATPLYCEKGVYFDRDGRFRFFREETTMARIARHFPEAKIIISLRDPITRIPSIHKKNFYQGKISTRLSEEINREMSGGSDGMNYIFRNRYDVHLEDVYRHFSKERVHVMIFEDWIGDVQRGMSGVSEFLGIPSLDVWPDIPDKKNTVGEYKKDFRPFEGIDPIDWDQALKNKVLDELAPMRAYVETLLGRAMPWETQK